MMAHLVRCSCRPNLPILHMTLPPDPISSWKVDPHRISIESILRHTPYSYTAQSPVETLRMVFRRMSTDLRKLSSASQTWMEKHLRIA